jgi:hypothetical protein
MTFRGIKFSAHGKRNGRTPYLQVQFTLSIPRSCCPSPIGQLRQACSRRWASSKFAGRYEGESTKSIRKELPQIRLHSESTSQSHQWPSRSSVIGTLRAHEREWEGSALPNSGGCRSRSRCNEPLLLSRRCERLIGVKLRAEGLVKVALCQGAEVADDL